MSLFTKTIQRGLRSTILKSNITRPRADQVTSSVRTIYSPSVVNFSRSILSQSASSTISCSCGGFHSEGDKIFGEFLDEEISQERENAREIPPVPGWGVKVQGAQCELTKQVEGDKISVKFNVNGSVPSLQENEEGHHDDLVSRPEFTVEVTKPANRDTLMFECFYPQEDGEHEERENVFSVQTVTLFHSEIDETTYSIDTENIDPELYDHLLSFLEDRGVNNNLAQDISTLSTAVENAEYINSLGRLKSFVNCL